MPGPAMPLYSAGAQLLHFYPISAVTDGQGLNMTVQSYNGNLDFGFVSCRELVPDLWHMTDLLQESMAEYLALAQAELAKADAPPAAAPAKKAAATRKKKAAAPRKQASPRAKKTAAPRKKKAAAPRAKKAASAG